MGHKFRWDRARDAKTVATHGALVLSDNERVSGILGFRSKRAKRKKPQPSTSTTVKWHAEYLESGAQYRMSFASFRARKMNEWKKARKAKKQKQSEIAA